MLSKGPVHTDGQQKCSRGPYDKKKQKQKAYTIRVRGSDAGNKMPLDTRKEGRRNGREATENRRARKRGAIKEETSILALSKDNTTQRILMILSS